ncbi:MAG: hypothetical protein K9M11_00885 [Candidatus Pacebacteria bacterium]|nr:hypothetical protein [Candidatus Paceibacterota bacterium]
MKKSGIVYVLGAGASANALPVVSEMIERLQVFYLTLFIFSISDSLEPENRERINKLMTELKDLLDNLKNKRSIDTYAKELHIKKTTSKLDILKALLGTYLSFEEMFSDNEMRSFFETKFPNLIDPDGLNDDKRSPGVLNSLNTETKNKLGQPSNSGQEYIDELSCLKYLYRKNISTQKYQNNKTEIDQRYINFLIDVMEKVDSFPSNIKLFSWNYDSQFLHAIKNLEFKIPVKDGVIDYLFLKRLNGVAVRKGINPATISSNLKFKGKIIESSDCFWRLSHPDSRDENLLVKFAFEQDQNIEKLEISSHLNDFDSVSDLVIIGYSFPLSNRNIDKNVFDSILKKVEYTRDKMINLKIYIQVPPDSDVNNDQYVIIKAKIIAVINSIIPGLDLSSDGNELSHVKKVTPVLWIGSDITSLRKNENPEDEVFETLKIKFYRQWDPVNFYIPQSF